MIASDYVVEIIQRCAGETLQRRENFLDEMISCFDVRHTFEKLVQRGLV
jgi:hypothetical protein